MTITHRITARRVLEWLGRSPVAGLLVTAVVLATTGATVLTQQAPSPVPTGFPADVLSLACAPSVAYEVPLVPLRVTGSQESVVRYTFGPGDLIVINGGTDNDIEVGQEYFTRRAVPVARGSVSRNNPATIHTSGWIRVYAVDEQLSLATVTFGCDSIDLNDYLEPFVLPNIPSVSILRPKAQRDNYGRVLTGSDNRTSFGRGDYFVIDRGSNHGIASGAQFVVYRDKLESEVFLVELAEAVAVDVGPEISTLQVTVSHDAFTSGDYVALRK